MAYFYYSEAPAKNPAVLVVEQRRDRDGRRLKKETAGPKTELEAAIDEYNLWLSKRSPKEHLQNVRVRLKNLWYTYPKFVDTAVLNLTESVLRFANISSRQDYFDELYQLPRTALRREIRLHLLEDLIVIVRTLPSTAPNLQKLKELEAEASGDVFNFR